MKQGENNSEGSVHAKVGPDSTAHGGGGPGLMRWKRCGKFAVASAQRLDGRRFSTAETGAMVHACHWPARGVFVQIMFEFLHSLSPEPTAVGAVSSAVAVHVASRRWLSFLR